MTIRMTVRFTVRPDAVDAALDAIRTFVPHTRTEPGTIRYESWRSRERPRDFLHLMEFADEAGRDAHASSPAVNVLTSSLYPLCEDAVSFEAWNAVG